MLYFVLSVLVQNWYLLHLARFYIEPITHMVLKTAPHFSVSHGTIGFHFHLQCWFQVEPCDTWYVLNGTNFTGFQVDYWFHLEPWAIGSILNPTQSVPSGTNTWRFYLEPSVVGSKWNQHLMVLFGTRFHLEPLWFYARTFDNWFHKEPKSVPPGRQRSEPILVPYRTFCSKSVRRARKNRKSCIQ